ALRGLQNLHLFGPADASETMECWQLALAATKTPSILSLSRQNADLVRKAHTAENLSARGAYELAPANLEVKVTLFASGTEVGLALAAQKALERDGIGTPG